MDLFRQMMNNYFCVEYYVHGGYFYADGLCKADDNVFILICITFCMIFEARRSLAKLVYSFLCLFLPDIFST